jgi:hypothetical protein
MDLVGGDTSSTKRLGASALLFRHRLGGATRYYQSQYLLTISASTLIMQVLIFKCNGFTYCKLILSIFIRNVNKKE